jgi:hypothetical protein
MPNGEEVEVVIHEDESILFVRDSGNFIT